MAQRGRWLLLPAAMLTLALIGYRFIPNVQGIGSFIDTFAPWLGVGVPLLVLLALIRRAPVALAAACVPALLWAVLFGGAWLPHGGGTPRLTVATQNLLAGNPDPAATIRELGRPDLLALQEVTPEARDEVVGELDERYPYHAITSTVSLWSRFPIISSRPVDTGLGWRRALRAEVKLPGGTAAIYVVHLGSLRPGQTEVRDRTIAELAERVRADKAQRLLILGDFNTASTDRAFRPLTDLLTDAQSRAGTGPGFTWPAALPLVRLDHILYRGMDPVTADTPRTPGSDHRAATAAFA
ncbi:vancomycin resistance protein VanJ [Allocatelliglobosispora scoriae]|uniref:Vancomycin resistance protein VanJ n=1 Tax=Allocatelliglobosispora scoriae TaxID=643052 RepID=A0A841BSH8_9ACTN|nr:endonuclease/exonuclease/phosphatase family protein [Allocatelliglobosispora scoriae]MBB5870139.1 vancomycin resistance protein VanJ [Allocatelliglobosispora scoriae]